MTDATRGFIVLPSKTSFVECDTCKAKPGTPTLCNGCLTNRNTIAVFEEERHRDMLDARARIRTLEDRFPDIPDRWK